jgi:hypothetical protein
MTSGGRPPGNFYVTGDNMTTMQKPCGAIKIYPYAAFALALILAFGACTSPTDSGGNLFTGEGISGSGSGGGSGSGSDGGTGTGGGSSSSSSGSGGSGSGSGGGSGYTLSGVITDSENQPLIGVQVVLNTSGGASFGSPAATGADGSYSIALTGIDPGQWFIQATRTGYTAGESAAFEVTGAGNIIRDLSIEPQGYSVNGVISTDIPGGPAVGATVVLRTKSGSAYATTTTNCNGYYAIGNVPTESGYYVEATFQGYKYQRSESFNVNTLMITKNLTLENTDPGSGQTPPPASCTISGRITTSNGGSPNGALVQLSGEAALPVSVDSGGAYTLSGVAAGTYIIWVDLEGYDLYTSPVFTVSGNISGKDIQLTKTVPLPVTYTISGTISTADGGSPKGARVLLLQDGSPAGEIVSTSFSGGYTISGVSPGTYTVMVTLPKYNVGEIGSFTVSGDVTKNLQLTTLDATGYYMVCGHVSTKTGVPAVGATVKLRAAGAYELTDTVTGLTGYYVIKTTEWAAEYFVKVKSTGEPVPPYPTDSAYVTLTLGTPKAVDVLEKY